MCLTQLDGARSRSDGASFGRPRRTLSIGRHWQVAVLLIEEGVEPFVIAGRHVEELDERPIAAASPLQTSVDERE